MTDLRSHSQPDTDSGGARGAVFATTHWSIVLAAGATQTTDAQQALSRLCQSYWYPLYAYAMARARYSTN